MKKILAGMLSVLLTTNVNAALISFEIYDSELYDNLGWAAHFDGTEKGLVAQSNDIVELSLAVNNIGSFRTRNLAHHEMSGSQGQVIGYSDLDAAWAAINPFLLEHPYLAEMAVLNSKYIKEATDSTTEYFSEAATLSALHSSVSFFEEQSADPNYFGDVGNVEISANSHNERYWLNNENGTIAGQAMMTRYDIIFEGDTELPFTNYDDQDELFSAIEDAIAKGSDFIISQHINLISFELINPLGNPLCTDGTSNYCEEVEGVKILKEESLTYKGKARGIAIDYADVPEPSTNLLLAMGLIGLVRLKRLTQA
ncbi:PEP-CTERM sorting domain-containing protein [Thalassomonas haliotis]|uniref:PEP-CTERM sorting domain-containing protein n=1 Tax=Thalassomonas haliotis TaxID=485448 RepID=A0ABY7VGS1_9GAMM|nr:PEP-CTERM sorting domain-containing protein [Thalassomonas haliotis]WDE12920.1 PEP-CTERM sorting domain-containing protein [Thalassomonas haliotis]